MGFIKYVQSKPKNVRAQYSALIAGLCTFVIGAVWASTLPARFANIDATAVKEDMEETGRFGSFLKDATTQLGNTIGWNKDTQQPTTQMEEIMEEVVSNQSAEEHVEMHDDVGSALSSLGAENASTTDAVSTTTSGALQNLGAVDELVATSTPETILTTTAPQIPMEPRVILIATTSSQKSE